MRLEQLRDLANVADALSKRAANRYGVALEESMARLSGMSDKDIAEMMIERQMEAKIGRSVGLDDDLLSDFTIGEGNE